MQLNEPEKEILTLLSLGALIAMGKILIGGEPLTTRLIIGRMIIGAALSASAGAFLMVFKDLPSTALIGIASALGILGQSYLELIAAKFIGRDKEADKEADKEQSDQCKDNKNDNH